MSTVILDTITGKSTATTITIGSTPVVSASANSMTIRGEGTAQTSIQQGLAKAWANTSGDGTPAIDDSFNNASVTDNGTGDQTFAFTNNMSNSNYCCNTGVLETGFVICMQILGQATSNTQIKTHDVAGTSSADSDGKNYSNNGDLA